MKNVEVSCWKPVRTFGGAAGTCCKKRPLLSPALGEP